MSLYLSYPKDSLALISVISFIFTSGPLIVFLLFKLQLSTSNLFSHTSWVMLAHQMYQYNDAVS